MAFVKKETATDENGKIKKGFKMITKKNGKEVYMRVNEKEIKQKTIYKKGPILVEF